MNQKRPTKSFSVAKTTPPEKDAPPSERAITEEEKFELCNAASSTDCTGLIPTPPLTEAEMEAYMQIYDYQPFEPAEHEKRKEKEVK